jgi:two-component system chemotaxis response regulator CheY
MKALDRSLPVLVVDDSRTMCEIMCRILKQAGFSDCHFAMEGIDALAKLKSTRYGLLMTDLNMNPISGPDLIRLIWSDRDISPIPTVLTSGNHHGVARAVIDSERELADVYILKPFTAAALDRKLKDVFGEDA